MKSIVGKSAFASQFHYGSIKTKMLDEKLTFEGLSQFHYGSIKTALDQLNWRVGNYVSIPLWFD